MVKIDSKAKELYDVVENIVSPVYLVGGCVRDFHLGRPVNDYDLSTPLTPDEMEIRIKAAGKRCLDIGKKFGTLGIHHAGDTIEITSFRKEAYKPGNRKPSVEFVGNITADLSRRDFTINALAWRNGKTIDPFNGRQDMKDKIIRSVGNPTERFKEDPLRMLRACRFASQLGFTIEEQTFKKMEEHAHNIMGVSKERYCIELDKLLMGDYVGTGLRALFNSKLINYIIPELGLQYNFDQHSKYHKFLLHEHTIKTVENTPKDINLRWAALLHDIGKPFVCREKRKANPDDIMQLGFAKHEYVGEELVGHIALYLKWSNDRRDTVKSLVLHHQEDDSPLREADEIAHGVELE